MNHENSTTTRLSAFTETLCFLLKMGAESFGIPFHTAAFEMAKNLFAEASGGPGSNSDEDSMHRLRQISSTRSEGQTKMGKSVRTPARSGARRNAIAKFIIGQPTGCATKTAIREMLQRIGTVEGNSDPIRFAQYTLDNALRTTGAPFLKVNEDGTISLLNSEEFSFQIGDHKPIILHVSRGSSRKSIVDDLLTNGPMLFEELTEKATPLVQAQEPKWDERRARKAVRDSIYNAVRSGSYKRSGKYPNEKISIA